MTARAAAVASVHALADKLAEYDVAGSELCEILGLPDGTPWVEAVDEVRRVVAERDRLRAWDASVKPHPWPTLTLISGTHPITPLGARNR